jgi:hypothetical protein
MQKFLFVLLLLTLISNAYSQVEIHYKPKEFHLFDYSIISSSFGSSQTVDTTFYENGSIHSINKYHTIYSEFNLDNNQVYKTVLHFNRCGEIYLKSEYMRSGNPLYLGVLGYQYTTKDTPFTVSPCPIRTFEVK